MRVTDARRVTINLSLGAARFEMSNLPGKHQKVVASEISRWQKEGTIDTDLAQRLTAQYPLHASRPNVSQAVSIVGAVLVGLGAILFMAANWQEISVLVKLLAIFAAIHLSHFFGWRLSFEPGNRPKLGAALLLLGSIFYGAAIWLVAQIFNLDASFPAGVLLWGLGTLASATAATSVPLGCMAAILGGIWVFANYSWDSRQLLSYLPSFLSYFAVCAALAFHLKSRAVAWITFAFSAIWMAACGPIHNASLMLFGTALLGGYFYMREKKSLFELPFLYVGSISTLGGLSFATFTNWFPTDKIPMTDLATLMIICFTVLGLVAWKVPKFKEEILVCAGLALIGSLLIGCAETYVRLGANILLLAAIGAFIYTGLMRVQSAALVNVALVFFVLDIIARYFDVFYTLMNRSFFFVVGGFLLMLVGALTEKGRRSMLEGMQS